VTAVVDATPVSPRAGRPGPGESYAGAIRRTASQPFEALFAPGQSPRAGAPGAMESFADALRRTASAPIAPKPEAFDHAPRAGDDPFGRSFHDGLRFSAHQQVAPAGVDPARDAAEQLVAISFIQPVLSSLRESNMAADPFGPGDAERRFGPMWDAAIAQRVVKARGFGLVDAVARSVRREGDGAGFDAAPAEVPPHAHPTAAPRVPALDALRAARAIDLDA
jgi:Rod binding domain-containing protein